MKGVIKSEGLSKYYGKGGEIKAVDGLDLEVYEGETFGLLGPNGSGKTTNVRLLNGIIARAQTDTFKLRMLCPSNKMLEMSHIMFEITNIENRGMNAQAQGFLGEFSEIEMIENASIRFKGANGVLRIDMSKDALWPKPSVKKEFE